MMSDLDAREASGTVVVLNSEGPTGADDNDKETGSGTLNGLLHVLAEVMHLRRLGVWANS